MTHPFQWSLFVGPAWQPSTNPTYFSWTGFTVGGASAIDFGSTLTSTLNSGATSAVLAAAASFASAGGIWVGPNGAGQAWEYMPYTGKSSNTLTGLVRESTADREHNGVHSSGATVRQWLKISSNDGRLRVRMSLDDLLVATDWQFEVSGIAAPQVAFRPFHLAILQARFAVTGNLLTQFVGFLDASSIRDDAKRVRTWSARVMSMASLLRRIQVDGVRVGDFDLAVHGSASSSIVLGAAHKERNVGDFVAANPSFEANNVLDEDDDSLWIGDRIIGTDETPTGYEGISQAYINPPNTINGGTRWIEIINRDTASVDLVVWDADANAEYILDIASQALGTHDRYIVAENAVRFAAENPSQQAAFIFDVSGSDNPNWFDHVRAHGGAIALRTMGANYSSAVYWGSIDHDDTEWDPDGWTGPSLPAPSFDQTMRYKMLDAGHTNTKDDWEVSRRQSPGYTIEDNNLGEQAWIAVTLPSMGLILHENITNTTPGAGATLLIDGQDGPSTDGLPASGTLVVGDERISYSAKVAGGVTVSARGASSTTAANHVAGDAIFLVFSQGGRETITDALPLKELKWERWGGTVYPSNFKWRYSALEARTPDEEQHEDDYEVTNTYTSQSAASHTQSLSNNRAATVLLEIQKMTVNAARPRVNRLKALVDPAYFDASQWLSGGETVEELIEQIAVNAGISTSLVLVTGGGAAPLGFTTAIDNAWSVMASVAELGGSWIQTTRASKLEVFPDDFWVESVGGYTPAYTWDVDNVHSVEMIRNGGAQVSQVKITWETPDGNDGGVAVWPTTKADLGAVLEMGPLYFATEAGAILAARKRYYLSRYPYEFMVTLAEGDLDVEPRQIGLLEWKFANDMQNVGRHLLIRQVEHYVEQQTLHTVIFGIQIDRESDG